MEKARSSRGKLLEWRLAQKLERQWWRTYLSRKDPDRYLNWKRAYWAEVWSGTGWALPEGLDVLDAGCGPAGIFCWLDRCRVQAVDPLLASYYQLKDHFRPEQFPWTRFAGLRLEDPGLLTLGRFDLLCCTNALNHVADLEGAAENLVAAGRPGSRFLLTLDVHRGMLGKWVLRRIPLDALHPQQGDTADYLGLLTTAGLGELTVRKIKSGRWFDHVLITGIKK